MIYQCPKCGSTEIEYDYSPPMSATETAPAEGGHLWQCMDCDHIESRHPSEIDWDRHQYLHDL